MLHMPVFFHCFPLRIGLLAIAAFAGCSESPQDDTSLKSTVKEVRQHVDDAVDGSMDAIGPARAAFLKKLKTRLQSIDQKIEQLANKERDLTVVARVEWSKKVGQLEIRRDAAKKRLKTLSAASELGWSDLRDGAEAAWQDLDKAVDAALAE
jgi:hypothetical protein